MMKHSKRLIALSVAAAMAGPATVYATNGMNLEGYGPIATGMGGASFAYDNGTAASMNNPATLGLMEEGHRVDAALGMLGPDISTSIPMPGVPAADSASDQFWMPALGWARKDGQLTYGIALFGQGGMGTEYAANSFLAMGSGEKVRSEVSVGRLMAPLAFQVDEKLSVGGSVDFVWGGMDLMMAVPGNMLGAMMSNPTGAFADPNMGAALGAANWARIDFSNSSDFTGEATGTGYAGKLGATYQVTPEFTVGATYHSKTSLSDLSTNNATLSSDAMGGFEDSGSIKVRDFQWPETYGVGLAYEGGQWMVAADVMRINWSDVMDTFSLTYESQMGSFDVGMPQNWSDQTVYRLGGAYRVNQQLTLRAGYNYGKNPIPDEFVNPLFPATIEQHYTLGLGYAFNPAQEVNFSLTHAPEVKVTTPDGMTIAHSQTNWQLMYSHRF